MKKKGFPKGGERGGEERERESGRGSGEREEEKKKGKGKKEKKEKQKKEEKKEEKNWTNEQVIVLYLSTLKYVHVIMGLDMNYFEKNYGFFHFSLCFNVLAALIPELREKC